MAIQKLNGGVTEVFNGQADIVLFDAPEGGYTGTTTFAQVTAAGLSLGQIVQDSTSWNGDEPSSDGIKDEQGDPITTNVSAGTFGFTCDVASCDDDTMALLLKGTKIPSLTPGSTMTATNGVGFGVDLPVMTRPIAIINDEANKMFFFPKAKIVASLSLDNKLWRIKLNVSAESIQTATLWTAMKINGQPVYA